MCWCVPSPHPITQNRVSSLSFLVNLSLSSFRVCLSLLPPLWLVGFLLPALHWLRARCGWGDRVVHGQGSWLNFSKVLNFSAASISHFHFSTNHLAAIILHSCLTTACHHAISSPPRPPSTERPLGMSFSLPHPSHIPPQLAPSLE